MPRRVARSGGEGGGQVVAVHHDQGGDRPGQADVEPAQSGDLVGLARRRCRPAPAARRGRTPGPWPARRDQVDPGAEVGRLLAEQVVADAGGLEPGAGPAATAASATITPTVPSRASASSTAVDQRRPAAVPRWRRRSSSPRWRRTECGGVRAGAIVGQQPGGEVDHRAGHPEAGDQFGDLGLGVAEMGERLRPGPGGPRRGRLGQVAQHGDRAGAGAAADRAQLHRRQVLGLVHDHVPETRRPAEQVGGLVDQDHVGEGPAGRLRRPGRFAVIMINCCSSGVEDALGLLGQEVARRSAAGGRASPDPAPARADRRTP